MSEKRKIIHKYNNSYENDEYITIHDEICELCKNYPRVEETKTRK